MKFTSLATAIENFLGTTRKFVFGRLYFNAIVLDILLVMITRNVVQFLVNSTGEDKGRQRMEVSQKNYRMDNFG